MGIADSPLRDQVVFVQGAPRSGTTWLTLMLANHPSIAGIGSESHLFDLGVDRLFDNFEQSNPVNRYLVSYLARGELVDLVRDLCDGVLEQMRARTKPDAPLVLEKTPAPALRPELALARKVECYPDAWYVHIVRDGGAVTRSLMRAHWVGDRSEVASMRRWRRSVDAIRDVLGDHPRYREVRYEDLQEDPSEAYADLFRWLGIDAGPDVAERIGILATERYATPWAQARDRSVGGLRQRLLAELAWRVPSLSHLERRYGDAGLGKVIEGGKRLAGRSTRDGTPPVGARLVTSIRDGDAARLRAVTSDSLVLEFRSGEGDLRATGEEARTALLAIGRHTFGRRFASETWAVAGGQPSQTLVLTGIGGDGTRVDMCFVLFTANERISRVQLISAGAPGGRPLHEWSPHDGAEARPA